VEPRVVDEGVVLDRVRREVAPHLVGQVHATEGLGDREVVVAAPVDTGRRVHDLDLGLDAHLGEVGLHPLRLTHVLVIDALHEQRRGEPVRQARLGEQRPGVRGVERA
jgi:hypothetical protein